MSRFPARKKALAVLAAVSAVGVAASACAGSGSGGKPRAAGPRPSAASSSSGSAASSPSASGSATDGATGGSDGSPGNSGHSGSGTPTPGSPDATGSTGSSSSSGDSSAPGTTGPTGSSGNTGTTGGPGGTTPPGGTTGSTGTTPTVPIPTAPGYQPPASPRMNSGVDCSTAKCIALTFDDGPGPDTGRLLDLLQREHVPATFFVLGDQAEKFPGTVRREYAEGHEIGNHTFDHKDLSTLSAAAVQDEIKRGADAIAAAGVPRPTLVRPPYGAVNDTVRTYAGYPFVMWRVDPLDWKYPNAQRVADQIVTNARPGRIVLSHDIHKTTIDAMPAVIQRLKAQGYTFVTVSTLMKGVNLQNGQSYFTRPASMTGTGAVQGQQQSPQYPQSPPNQQGSQHSQDKQYSQDPQQKK